MLNGFTSMPKYVILALIKECLFSMTMTIQTSCWFSPLSFLEHTRAWVALHVTFSQKPSVRMTTHPVESCPPAPCSLTTHPVESCPPAPCSQRVNPDPAASRTSQADRDLRGTTWDSEGDLEYHCYIPQILHIIEVFTY